MKNRYSNLNVKLKILTPYVYNDSDYIIYWQKGH